MRLKLNITIPNIDFIDEAMEYSDLFGTIEFTPSELLKNPDLQSMMDICIEEDYDSNISDIDTSNQSVWIVRLKPVDSNEWDERCWTTARIKDILKNNTEFLNLGCLEIVNDQSLIEYLVSAEDDWKKYGNEEDLKQYEIMKSKLLDDTLPHKHLSRVEVAAFKDSEIIRDYVKDRYQYRNAEWDEMPEVVERILTDELVNIYIDELD